MTERKLLPHIRFKGFKEEWKTQKLKEFSKIVGGGTPDTNKSDYWNGNINWYSPTEIGKKPYVYSSNKKITELGLKKSSAKIHPANTTILFTSRAGIGDMAILKKPAATNQGFQSIELGDNASPYFIYSYGFVIKNIAERLASGSTFLEISKRDMERIALKLPTLKEQQKIGILFAKLDRLLDLQQQKLDQLELLKKALLQKLFPKQDAKIPELRFKGFAEEWKKEELGSLSDIVRGASPRPIQDKKWFSKDSNIGWLRISDVTEQNGKIYHLEQKLSPLGQEKTRVVKNKHLLLSIAATVGSPVINYIPTGVHDGFLIFLNPQFNIDFMFQWLTYYKNNWAKYGQPGSQVNLNSKIVKNQRIYIPGLNEQQKIGNLFAKIDRLIELQNKKFDNLKQVKKSLLQNMFVE